ncbi:L-gulonolactone/D-arabinono-1,4-lactone oxidase [Trichodelitschia bisporula]|uniref:D-arabinono-1,4-lactone oxidase n=1 Tax=Trichodelitschia bisporula TaxID=703511 RepID=A0A6G1HK67_9PEZI|nr:L-gulonolactone/D-arabinono-1,4-lactone oxidase [Trichodelitschia bisporula]
MNPHLASELARFDPDPAIPLHALPHHTHHTWARTFHSRPELYIQPHSLAEIQKTVTLARRCRRRIVVVGSGHCPSDITCTSAWMVNLDKYASVLRVNAASGAMLVQAGIRIHDLNLAAKEHGLTVPSLGSIDEQSIAGAIATGTHGSSMRHGLLSQNVLSLRIVLANGAAVRCSPSQNADLFRAALVSLGALGVVVEVEYRMVPHANIHWAQRLVALDEVLSTWNADLWTRHEYTRVWWLPYTKRAVVWTADKTASPPQTLRIESWYAGAVGYRTYHALLWLSHYIPRLLPAVEWFVFGMQYGFKLGGSGGDIEEQRTGLLMNCLYSQFVNEWALPLERGPEAISRLSAWLNHDDAASGIPFPSKGIWVHAPIEVRVSGAPPPPDQRPFLDPSQPVGGTLYLNATLYRPYGLDPPCTQRYYAAFEYLMKELGGRPHWAKNFATVSRADIESMYGADLEKWRGVRAEVDPEGVFVGPWVRRTVIEEDAGRGAPLACEEVEVGRVGRKEGGAQWVGRQGGFERRGSAGSSVESFEHMAGAEAEASGMLESRWEEDVEKRVREGAREGVTGVRVFDKM